MWNVIGMMALVLSTSNVVRAEEFNVHADIRNLIPLANELGDLLENPSEVDPKRSPVLMEELSKLNDRIKAKCPDDDKSSDCSEYFGIRERLKMRLFNAEAAQKEAEHAATAEGIADEACNDLNQVNVAKSVIAHEKQVGKISGVVNNLVLHQAGEHIVEWQSNYNNTAARYKAKTGKAFSSKNCQ